MADMKKYPDEFKREALKLAGTSWDGKVGQVERDLGITPGIDLQVCVIRFRVDENSDELNTECRRERVSCK